MSHIILPDLAVLHCLKKLLLLDFLNSFNFLKPLPLQFFISSVVLFLKAHTRFLLLLKLEDGCLICDLILLYFTVDLLYLGLATQQNSLIVVRFVLFKLVYELTPLLLDLFDLSFFLLLKPLISFFPSDILSVDSLILLL